VDLLYGLAEGVIRLADPGPSLWLALLYLLIVMIPMTLVHELGHALAARRLLDSDVRVVVGGTGRLMEFQLGRIALTVNALSLPGRAAGVAEVDASRATARDVMLIAVAGPATSLVGVLVTGLALASAPPTGVVHELLRTATFLGIIGVLNLIPITYRERRNGRKVRNDGRLALDALRVMWALR
jgi:hypothetical protein